MTEEIRKKILAQIDSGEWKHSWHLKKTDCGIIDWHDPLNRKKIIEILISQRNEAINTAYQCCELIKKIEAENPAP